MRLRKEKGVSDKNKVTTPCCVTQALPYLLMHKSLLQCRSSRCWEERTRFQDGGIIERSDVRRILELAGKGDDDICEYFPCIPIHAMDQCLEERRKGKCTTRKSQDSSASSKSASYPQGDIRGAAAHFSILTFLSPGKKWASSGEPHSG